MDCIEVHGEKRRARDHCSGKRTRAAGGERLTQAGRGTYPEDLGESEHVSVRPFPTSALVAHVRIITLPCLKDELRGYNTIPHLVFLPLAAAADCRTIRCYTL